MYTASYLTVVFKLIEEEIRSCDIVGFLTRFYTGSFFRTTWEISYMYGKNYGCAVGPWYRPSSVSTSSIYSS